MYSVTLSEENDNVIVVVTFQVPKKKVKFIKRVQDVCDAAPSELSELFSLPLPVIDKIIDNVTT